MGMAMTRLPRRLNRIMRRRDMEYLQTRPHGTVWENPELFLTRECERGNKPKPGEPSIINRVLFLEHDAAGFISHRCLLNAAVTSYDDWSMRSRGISFSGSGNLVPSTAIRIVTTLRLLIVPYYTLDLN